MERRQHPRQRTLLGAKLEFSNTHVYDCVITNLSPNGARIRCSAALALPARMVLNIPSHAEKHAVSAIWRTPDGLGVSFVKAESAAPPVISKMGRLLAHIDQ